MMEDIALIGMILLFFAALVLAFLIVAAVKEQSQKEDLQVVFEGDKYKIEFISTNPFIPDSVTTITVAEVKRNRRGTIWCKVVDGEGCVSHLTQEDLLDYYTKV